MNRPLDAALTEALAKIFLEVIIAPEATPEALEMVSKRRNLRLLLAGGLPDPDAPRMTFKSVAGGILLQSADNGRVSREALKVVTRRAPTPQEPDDLLFAFLVCKHVKSNAIVYAKDGATVGIGAGQMSRVDSSRIAAWKPEEAGKAAGLPAASFEEGLSGTTITWL